MAALSLSLKSMLASYQYNDVKIIDSNNIVMYIYYNKILLFGYIILKED